MPTRPRRAMRRLLPAFVAILPVAVAAQQVVPGFNVSFSPPAGWTLAGQDGQAQAWSEPRQGLAMFTFAAAFSSLETALAEARPLLASVPQEGARVVEAPAMRRVGGVEAMTSTIQLPGADRRGYTIRLLARASAHGTVLVAIGMAPSSADAAARAAVEGVIASMRAAPPTDDPATARAITGAWGRQESNMSGNGGYVTEEGWQFAPDGRFRHVRTHTVSMPGASVEPTRTREEGQWRAIGGALVVTTGGVRTTIPLKPQGAVLLVNGVRFTRR